jgi:hypothetical protein
MYVRWVIQTDIAYNEIIHLSIVLQSLRALCLAPGGPGSNCKYIEALVNLTGVSGELMCSLQTDLHFANTMEVEQTPHFFLENS